MVYGIWLGGGTMAFERDLSAARTNRAHRDLIFAPLRRNNNRLPCTLSFVAPRGQKISASHLLMLALPFERVTMRPNRAHCEIYFGPFRLNAMTVYFTMIDIVGLIWTKTPV